MDIITFLCFLGLCFGAKRFFQLPIEVSPVIVVASIIAFLYGFAYFSLLNIGVYVCLLVGVGALSVGLYECATQKIDFFNDYVTPGMAVWMGFVVPIGFVASGRLFGFGDELMHWAPHSRVMFENQGFLLPQDQLFHKSYPPGARLWHYFFYCLSGFSEGRAHVAQLLISMSPLCLFAKGLAWRNWRRAFLFVTMAFFIILLYSNRVAPLLSIMMERPLGVFLGAALVVYFMSDKKPRDIALLAPILFAVMLFKLKMLSLVMLVIGIVCFDQCLQAFLKRKIPGINVALAIIGLVLSVFLAKFSWLHYLYVVDVPLEWNNPFTFHQILASFSSSASERDIITIQRFLYFLLEQSVLISVLLLFSILCPFGFNMYFERLRWWWASAWLFVGLLAYLFGLLLLYLYVFIPFHGMILASIYRYSAIYFLAWTFFVLGAFVTLCRERESFLSRRAENISVVVFLFILILSVVLNARGAQIETTEHRSRQALRLEIKKITDPVRVLTPPDAAIFTVWQNTMGFQAVTVFYELMPRHVNERPIAFGPAYTSDYHWTRDISPGDFLKSLHGYDYLLLAHTDAQFWARYGVLFSNVPPSLAPLVQYHQCEGDIFNDALSTGCTLKKNNAYLFQILNVDGNVELHNVATDEG